LSYIFSKNKNLQCLLWVILSTLCAPITFERTRCFSWNLLERRNRSLSPWKYFQALRNFQHVNHADLRWLFSGDRLSFGKPECV
jgi:hypothetical protein